jgi:flagellar motor switch protein FliN
MMTEQSNMDQTNSADSAEINGQGMVNNMAAEETELGNPELMDFVNVEPMPRPAAGGSENIDMLMDVNLQFTVELGRTQMPVRQILELQNGSVVELDRIAGDAVDVFINEHLMARGEVVVVDDKFGVRITELISPTKGK